MSKIQDRFLVFLRSVDSIDYTHRHINTVRLIRDYKICKWLIAYYHIKFILQRQTPYILYIHIIYVIHLFETNYTKLYKNYLFIIYNNNICVIGFYNNCLIANKLEIIHNIRNVWKVLKVSMPSWVVYF